MFLKIKNSVLYKLIGILIIHNFHLVGQIPNQGFENWTTVSNYNIPDGWGTLNNTYTVQTATKGSPGNPGISYLKLTSKTNGSSVINGIAVSGKLDSITQQPIHGFPLTTKPLFLTGKYQHMIYGTSQGSIKITLTRWDNFNNIRITIAQGSVTLSGMAMSWANFSVPINYFDPSSPDSCIIVLRSSGTVPTNNDYLWVDDLNFSGTYTNLNEHFNENNFFVFPNPTSKYLYIKHHYSGDIIIKLIQLNGEIVFEGKVNKYNNTIDLSELSKGLYYLKLITKESTEYRSIIIE